MYVFEKLKNEIEKCNYCKEKFGFEPHPIFWGKQNSKIVQISQAPSNNVHKSMKPFTDMSGKTLKNEWYQIIDEQFYNTDNFFIGALAHCYPGKDKNGNDKQPPRCCWSKWIEKELQMLDNEIYIVIGAKAAKRFFQDENFEDLVFKNNEWNNKLTIVLPHPSPLNKKWLKDHPEFMTERIIEVRNIIKNVIKSTE
ncbi:MAG: uracil-DNA glycosylase [Clostridia bacterium]|nr:uracil-DNA glycosylase [Clostridia bacterium]